MRQKVFLLTLLMMVGVSMTSPATNLTVKMNTVSRTMTLTPKGSDTPVEAGTPSSYTYNFDVEGGDYLLTAYASDGTTVNGTIEVFVDGDSVAQQLTILTLTAYATNKNWVVDQDYTIVAKVNSREGKSQVITMGNSTTAGRKTFLAQNGNSYFVSFVPSPEREAEGYTSLLKTGTLTANTNISGAIPLGGDFTITVPADAGFELNTKRVHFTDFNHLHPKKVETKDGKTSYTYYLAQGQVYNYRTWKKDALTQAAYFTFSANEADRPVIELTDDDYYVYNPATINHTPQSNGGYETGDIFVNGNYKGFLQLKTGETFLAHAMRSWELTDNSTNNYFFEPDFHYTVIDLNGNPSSDVLEVVPQEPNTSAWTTLRAKGKGTVIVLVTYDGIKVDYWNKQTLTPYMGGEFWGAIWPENTAAYVVSVDGTPASLTANMLVNEKYNQGALKKAGDNVDAEHDVFYYLDTEEGALYSFKPEGVASVEIAYPVIGERMATYKGFTADGVTLNEDGTYTLLVKEGRNIVRLVDPSGNADYRVIRGRKCHREIVNTTRPGSNIYQPGDEVKVQYSGLYHPANKLAGIYNMSAYVTYNGIPNGTSLILSANQYTFGSAASAQAVTVKIPAEHDVTAVPAIEMTEGVIQVNGYGDPIGNHRDIDPVGGRSPNFTAIAHKTYFGHIPEVYLDLSPVKYFDIKVMVDVDDVDLKVSFGGQEIKAGENGLYSGTYGDYSVVASKKGYICYRNTFNIADNAEGLQTFNVEMTADANSWDGQTLTEPVQVEGVYTIVKGSELAWVADYVNKGNSAAKFELGSDIELGNYEWTAIGLSSSKPFSGEFNGNGHTVNGLFIDVPNEQYRGLFGYLKGSATSPVKISDLTINGMINVKSYGGALAGYGTDYVEIDRIAGNVTATGGTNLSGVIGYITGVNSKVTNCVNTADISGTGNTGGIVGGHTAQATLFENLLNTGTLTGNYVGGCVGSSYAKSNLTNAYTLGEYVKNDNQTVVTRQQLLSGEIAYRLGAAFGQTIGEQLLPTIGGVKVFKVGYSVVSDVMLLADDTDAQVVYTNGELPQEINGRFVYWYADPEMTIPVTAVDGDRELYLKLGVPTGIDQIETEADGAARWFNLQGLPVADPTPATRGIFIRVINGQSEKIVL